MKYKNKSKKRIGIYVGAILFLFVWFLLFHDSTWAGSKESHTLMEFLATVLAVFVGVLALIRFYTKKNNTFLFIGTGFMSMAFLDGYHAFATSTFFNALFPSVSDAFIPWGWNVSRYFLVILMLVIWWAWKREIRLGEKGIIPAKIVYIAVPFFALVSFIFYILLREHYPELFFGAQAEFGVVILFLFALVVYFIKGNWKKIGENFDSFDHWVILALIAGAAQALFMSFSLQVFDFSHDAAHVLKNASYLFILIGLLISMFYKFRRAEERKRQLEERTHSLEKIDQIKTEFVSVASHQLRTPLTAIKLFVEMLRGKKTGKLNAKQSEYLYDIAQSTERMIELVNDLLDVSLLEAGGLKIEFELVDLEKFIKEVMKNVSLLCKLKCKMAPLKIKGRKVEKVKIDLILMRQAIHNLLTNAVRYSKQDGEIIVTLEYTNISYIITVTNEGIGIPDDVKNEIFGRFYRANNAKKMETTGSGLGLYVSKMIIEALGGQIWFESTEGKKTSFYISIPKQNTHSLKIEKSIYAKKSL